MCWRFYLIKSLSFHDTMGFLVWVDYLWVFGGIYLFTYKSLMVHKVLKIIRDRQHNSHSVGIEMTPGAGTSPQQTNKLICNAKWKQHRQYEAHTKLVGVSRTREELIDFSNCKPQNVQWHVYLRPCSIWIAYSYVFIFHINN